MSITITKTPKRKLVFWKDGVGIIIQEKEAYEKLGNSRVSWDEFRIWVTLDELEKIIGKVREEIHA